MGFWRFLSGAPINYVHPPAEHIPVVTSLNVFMILRAFSNGCSAMTGTEAVANGVQAFRPPESRNAAVTMIWMAVILISLVLGITFLASIYRVFPKEN